MLSLCAIGDPEADLNVVDLVPKQTAKLETEVTSTPAARDCAVSASQVSRHARDLLFFQVQFRRARRSVSE